MSRTLPFVASWILSATLVCPLRSQQDTSAVASRCKRPNVRPFTSFNLPRIQNLFPVSRLSGTYQLVLVVESPRDQKQRILGMLRMTAFDTVLGAPFSGGPLLVSPAGFKLDFSKLLLSTDSVPRAPFDSSLFSATAIVNQRRETMTIGLGLVGVTGLQSGPAVLFVTDVNNGIRGLWVSQGGNDPNAPRGFFC